MNQLNYFKFRVSVTPKQMPIVEEWALNNVGGEGEDWVWIADWQHILFCFKQQEHAVLCALCAI